MSCQGTSETNSSSLPNRGLPQIGDGCVKKRNIVLWHMLVSSDEFKDYVKSDHMRWNKRCLKCADRVLDKVPL